MKIVKPSFEIINPDPFDREAAVKILKLVEKAGRTCYKSEDKITEDSAMGFVRKITQLGHHSVIEHFNITARIITDRGVTHELVRHRIASYSQESTRYCNYGHDGEISVIEPQGMSNEQRTAWIEAMEATEKCYLEMIKNGASPQIARSVLPNALKTEIVMTTNLREWLHVFKLRRSPASHPQIIEVMNLGWEKFAEVLPEVFFDDKK